MKTAFSTVVCPEWTLSAAVSAGAAAGFAGVELRTFGHDASDLACDPCLTGPRKARDIFEDAGIDPACFATSVRFDAPIWPPVLGRVLDTERSVREARELIRAAASYECPFVRVFGFELQPGEGRRAGLRRILQRLSLATTAARHTGVRLLLENGGSFPTAGDLLDIITRVGSPLLRACYSPAAALAAGEDPREGIRTLGTTAEIVRLRDLQEGRPAIIGDGDLRVEETAQTLGEIDFQGWTVVEHDRMWLGGDGDPADILTESAERLHGWLAAPAGEYEKRKYASASPASTPVA
ncbi:MAG: TIM barrel protein [Planctomycetota bacterium]